MRKKKHLFNFIFLLCLLFFAVYLNGRCTQGYEQDRYNLRFNYNDSIDFKWLGESIHFLEIDSSYCINDKYPLYIKQKVVTYMGVTNKMPLSVSLCQILSIPKGVEKEILEIKINTKSQNLKTLKLTVACINQVDDVVYIDSIELKNGNNKWGIDTLSQPLTNTERIIVGIYGWGEENYSSEQGLWLDRIDISIAGKKIGQYDTNYLSQNITPNLLKKGDVTPLLAETIHEGIVIPKDKKIVALGETLHGSSSINKIQVDLLKKMVAENNCKLIIIEGDFYLLTLWNLFIQGLLPIESLEEIRKEALLQGIIAPDIICEFLLWLKEYNTTANKKVKLLGNVDVGYDIISNPLFFYLNTFYNDDSASILYPLLKSINDRKFQEGLNYAQKEPSIRAIMGNDEYNLFYYLLERTNQNSVRSSKEATANMRNRDYLMWKHVDAFVQMFLEMDETAAVVAHEVHVEKKYSIDLGTRFPYIYPMGYYLNKKYKDSYYVIGLLVGEGNITNVRMGGRINSTIGLSPPLNNSLEKQCMNIDFPYIHFYSNKLPDGPISHRYGGNRVDLNDTYIISNLKHRADAFVFIRESVGSSNVGVDIPKKIADMKWDKGTKRAAIMREHEARYNLDK